VRLVTLNMRFGVGSRILDRPAYDVPVSARRLQPIVDALRSQQPDIVALQEVSSQRQAERLAEPLQMASAYVPHRSSYALDFFEWGLAFLFKGRLMDSGNYAIHFDEKRRYGRQALMVRVKLDAAELTVVNVHLEQADPVGQIANLNRFVAPFSAPVVLMGDFNRQPHDPALGVLASRWVDTCQAVASPASREAARLGTLRRPPQRIDYIFVEPTAFKVSEAGLLPPEHRTISDHIGYFADLQPAT
jgi:endonuclease/exonuclease/phosphatase family metal-dependent hydrolase